VIRVYDPAETNTSFEYLSKIVDECKKAKIKCAIIGGWGTFFHVNENYRMAFGTDYLKSRDIDIFVDFRDQKKFANLIKRLNFEKSGYFFRYELAYDREGKKPLTKEDAKKRPVYELIFIFLDVFSNAKTTSIGSWWFKELKRVRIQNIGGIPVADVRTLLRLKCMSFFEREKFDKEFKDACDIYALVVYGKKTKLGKIEKEAIRRIVSRNDLCEFIAEHVLKDPLKGSVVRMTLETIVKHL
jgi:hypothetical protein